MKVRPMEGACIKVDSMDETHGLTFSNWEVVHDEGESGEVDADELIEAIFAYCRRRALPNK